MEQIRRRRLKLWHLGVAVLASALFFGFVRSMFVGAISPTARNMVLGSTVLATCILAAAVFVWGVKLGNWTSLALLRQGDNREGIASMATTLFAVLVFIGILLISFVLSALTIVLAIVLATALLSYTLR